MTSRNELTTPVQIGHATGYLFESTLGEGLCFVPEDCLIVDSNARISLDGSLYLLSGWARRNGLFNPSLLARRLFPNTRAMIRDLAVPDVVEFVVQLRNLEVDLASA